MLCAKFGWNWSTGSKEEDKNVKSLWQQQQQQQQQQQLWTSDKLWIAKLTWAFGSGWLEMQKMYWCVQFAYTKKNYGPVQMDC